MPRTLKLTAALAAATMLGAGAAAADVVTYKRVYTAPATTTYHTAPVQTYVTGSPVVVTRGVGQVVAVPETVVTEKRYVARWGTTFITEQPLVTPEYFVPQSRIVTHETRVVVRPSDCGTYHYWNGLACVDARDSYGITTIGD